MGISRSTTATGSGRFSFFFSLAQCYFYGLAGRCSAGRTDCYPMDITETLSAVNREEFRAWLQLNHASKSEIWLINFKKATGKPSIPYLEAVEEAICFGWIDSFEKSIDQERYATRFTPRRPKSHWTESNKEKARKLIADGKMTKAGFASLPPDIRISGD